MVVENGARRLKAQNVFIVVSQPTVEQMLALSLRDQEFGTLDGLEMAYASLHPPSVDSCH